MSDSPDSLAGRLCAIRRQIAEAAAESRRSPEDIQLIAATKTRPVRELKAVAALGLTAFGENQWQEAKDKMAELGENDFEWHFIGPLQSNKTRPVSAAFDVVHSLDSEKTAGRLAGQRPAAKPPLRVLLQVNISREPNKRGVLPEEAEQLLAAVSQYENLQPEGLMAIPRRTEDEAAKRAPFARLRQLRDQLQERLLVPLPELSMGMSGDLAAAVAEGATMVRVGTALFGPRQGPAAARTSN